MNGARALRFPFTLRFDPSLRGDYWSEWAPVEVPTRFAGPCAFLDPGTTSAVPVGAVLFDTMEDETLLLILNWLPKRRFDSDQNAS